MKLLILRTDIKTKRMVNAIKPIFNNHPQIVDWSVDTEDIDNVLRVEVPEHCSENDIYHMIKPFGFYCESLPD